MRLLHGVSCMLSLILLWISRLTLVLASSHDGPSDGPQSAPVIPRMVRSHHLQEAKHHLKQGGKGAYEAVERGAAASGISLYRGCLTQAGALESMGMINHGLKNARAGLASCTNTACYSVKGVTRNLKHSVTEPKIHRTQQEFQQKKENDQRIRENTYTRLKSETESITPAQPRS